MTPPPTNPLALIAELTHRCPLHCVYCSNPLEMTARAEELPAETWSRVFLEAAQLGVLQADFTGGEPLAHPDILELVHAARAAGLYVNLITSGLPLDEARLAKLVEAGLDHLQLSFQGAREETAQEISGTKSHAQKLRVLEWLKKVRVAVTLNFVIHRHPHRIRQRPVLRLGLRQPRKPAAHPRTTRTLARNDQERGRAPSRKNPHRVCSPGLLREISQTLHGRLGPQTHADHAKRRRPALSRRKNNPGPAIRQRKAIEPEGNLGELRSLPKISRRNLDARSLQDLRPPHPRLRWLPLPSPAPRR